MDQVKREIAQHRKGYDRLVVRQHGAITLVLVVIMAAILVSAPTASAAGTVTITAITASSFETQVIAPAVEGQLTSPAINATFTDTNAVSPSNLEVTINWGDGTMASTNQLGPGFDPNLLVTQFGGAGGTTYTVTDNHTYPEEGLFAASLTVKESANAANADTSGAPTPQTVADAPLSPVLGASQTFSGTGTVGVTSAEAAMEAAIGGVKNTAQSEQTGGYRMLTWDGIKTDGSDTLGAASIDAHTVSLSPSRVQPFGLRLNGGVAVSDNGFLSVNPGVTNGSGSKLAAFSAPNDAAPFNGNALDLGIVAPASTTSVSLAQASAGVGVVFQNVTQLNTTAISFYSGDTLLQTDLVPAAGFSAPSFFGAVFSAPVVTRVVVTLGTASIFSWDGTTLTPGASDGLSDNLVAVDDIVLAEPAPQHPALTATAGAALSGNLDSFTDADPNATAKDFTAQIDWGDGTLGSATVAAGSSGAFNVSGSHVYAQAGDYTVTVTERDYGGAQRTVTFTANITPRSTTTRLVCTPRSLTVGTSATCTAAVTDTSSAPTAPGGQVSFAPGRPADGFGAGATCTLHSSGPAAASCSVPYLPGSPGGAVHTLTATYTGDGLHGASSTTANVTVNAALPPARVPSCSVSFPANRLAKHARVFKVTIKCDIAATVKLTATVTVTPKHGRSIRLAFGTASANVLAGRASTLTLRPTAKILARVRAAARRKARISLSATATATNPQAKGTATGSLPTLTVAS